MYHRLSDVGDLAYNDNEIYVTLRLWAFRYARRRHEFVYVVAISFLCLLTCAAPSSSAPREAVSCLETRLSESTCQEQRISVTVCVHQMEVGDKATAVDSSGTFGHLISSMAIVKLTTASVFVLYCSC